MVRESASCEYESSASLKRNGSLTVVEERVLKLVLMLYKHLISFRPVCKLPSFTIYQKGSVGGIVSYTTRNLGYLTRLTTLKIQQNS